MPGEDYQSWSVTAANNGNSDTSIEWREGQTRASVNNSSRSEMAAHAKNRNLLNGSIVTGGTANAQTFTSGVSYIAPIPTGLIVKLKIGASLTNTGPATLNMDGIGDTSIKTDVGEDIKGGELVGGCYTDFLWNGTNWIFLYSREYFHELITGGGGIIIGTQKFTATGAFVYTPTAGMECCIIECVGGGGGGGGARGNPGAVTIGGGGGSGGYSRKLAQAADIGTSQNGVVGIGGSSQAAGGDTNLGTLCIAKGGSPGGATDMQAPVTGIAGAGGVIGTGDLASAGAPGSGGLFSPSDNLYPRIGFGGSSIFGGGARAPDTSGAGLNANQYGSGGGGAQSVDTNPFSGGSGSAGIVIITEFAGRGLPGHDGQDGDPGPIGPVGPSGAGTGDVLRSGTPTVGQIAQWTDASHIQGVAAAGLVFTTGDGKITLKATADAGWVLMNDGTIGSATSGATTRANADTQALFNLLFANIDDIAAPLQTSAGAATTRAAQTNAATAWAANCRMSLTKQLGRGIAVAGLGAGLTNCVLGRADGNETHTLTTAELAPHAHNMLACQLGPSPGANTMQGSSGTPDMTAPTNSAGSGTPFNILNPRSYWNVMIKL